MGLTGEKVGINPSIYKIVEGEGYLLYPTNLTGTLKNWNKEQEG